MKRAVLVFFFLGISGFTASLIADEFAAELPRPVRAEWDLPKAFRETTPSRERICLNGLWRWQPATSNEEQPPDGRWGFFKVPGSWPGITDYMQKDAQQVFAHPAWKSIRLGEIQTAWYEREISVPADWQDRRIALNLESLNSFALVFVDGVKAGEIHFPGGELDLTGVCRPGARHRLTLQVVALPLKGVMLSYTDSASAREIKGSVARRGLCGDVFLEAWPRAERITNIRVETSVRAGELMVEAGLAGLASNGPYTVRARVVDEGRTLRSFSSSPFQKGELNDGRIVFREKWKPEKLWDLHTPRNMLNLELALLDAGGRLVDQAWTERFGFREFWIDGRDFYLNGSRIFLSAVPLDNAQVSAAAATYAETRETLERLKSFGINYVYTHNYGCEPGAHLSFAEILRAADDVGMLVGFTQPHFSHYDWKSSDADTANRYGRHASFYARAAGNHPSVVMYVMSHNATGYEEDMNPDMIDGIHEGRDSWALRNVRLAERAEAIVRGLDPGRIVYHHASGNLGVMHDSNFYPNFAPIQELDDWFEHWATEGVKPAFTCEYGAPFSWDWTMYRGWYKGQREWGSAQVPWEFCLAEWNAEFIGERAYQISAAEKANLRWEARQFREGKVWHRWDYPNPVGSDRFEERYPIFARYITDNWRAYRTWGVSGISPWEYGHFWKLRAGVDRTRKEIPTDWDHLQRPGFSPDFIDQRFERMDMAYGSGDWIATPAAEALIRNNRPLLAYIAGKEEAFTSKDHNFRPGETVEKQVVIINNSREAVTAEVEWILDLPAPLAGTRQVQIPAGGQIRVPVRFPLPETLARGAREIRMTARFGSGEVQDDRFEIDVLPRAPRPSESNGARLAIFDPKGETTAALAEIGVRGESVSAGSDLAGFDLLIIGKEALGLEAPAPRIDRVRDGLKVIVFEQTSEVMEKRLGFRVQERGLRRVFSRVPDHPVLAGLDDTFLHDWRGSSTVLAPRLSYRLRPRYGPTVEWAGLPATRVWRCGNRGNVASVLLEKPGCGDFLPVIDGGFSLQYSPLLEYREGQGLVMFCQLDVSGRTEADPAAQRLLRNLVGYVTDWKPLPLRPVVYAGDEAGRKFLEALRTPLRRSGLSALTPDDVVVLGPGSAGQVEDRRALETFVAKGGRIVAVGLGKEDLPVLSHWGVGARDAEHIAAWFAPFRSSSPFAGVSPAEVHNRDVRELPLISSGAEGIGDGVLGTCAGGAVVLVQMAPWTFAGSDRSNVRRTFRHAAILLSRVLANAGVSGATPLIEWMGDPVSSGPNQRWAQGLYLDQAEEWDDPYRFFRW